MCKSCGKQLGLPVGPSRDKKYGAELVSCIFAGNDSPMASNVANRPTATKSTLCVFPARDLTSLSGKLQIQKGKTGGYYTLLLIPFFVIGGLQFLHLLYACTISINLVCNKSKQVSTNETYENLGWEDFAKENETGLGEDIEISSPKPLQRPLLGKNNPAFAQLMARTQDPQMQQQMQMAQNMMQDPQMQRQMQQQMQMAQNTMQGVSKSTDNNNSLDKERPLSYGPDQP